MHGLGAADPGRRIDWGRTSGDYAAFRPGPPDSFYANLAALGIGVAGQRILDLGTGTGVLARRFAAEGARCAGIDLSAEQIETASRLARDDGLEVDFRVAPAEATPFEDASFDAVTASQCWLCFDAPRAIAEARRVAPGGSLVVAHFSWLPLLDPVARASEALVLRFNPQWSAAGGSGDVPPPRRPHPRARPSVGEKEMRGDKGGWRGEEARPADAPLHLPLPPHLPFLADEAAPRGDLGVAISQISSWNRIVIGFRVPPARR